MATIDRRSFLGLAGMAGAALLTGCTPGAGSAGRGNTGGLAWSTRLHVPSVDAGTVAADGTRRFRLRAQAGRSQFISGKSTTSWGYNGPYLGPTLRAQSGERVAMEVHNELTESTTVHWHGMRLPAAMDGTPHQPVEAGSVWRPTWTIDQPASTLWYHPHPHGDTAVHVYRGLAGMWIIDDDIPDGLPGTYGSDDIPLIIQDRNIGADGSLREDDTVPIWGLMGNDILVNGTHGPYLEVHTRLVRFRVLNASNARMYNLRLSDGRPITIVGNDCALLPAPVQVDEISLSPAERAEIVVAFNPGETVILPAARATTAWTRASSTSCNYAPQRPCGPTAQCRHRCPGQAPSRHSPTREHAGSSSPATPRSTAGRWRWVASTRSSPSAPPRSGRSTTPSTPTTSTSTTPPSASSTSMGTIRPPTPADGRTPCSSVATRPPEWPSPSGTTLTRRRRTCTTATSSSTRTRA